MPQQVTALAWFRREDYERIRKISGDAMQPSFDAWEAKMNKLIAELSKKGIVAEKVTVDPEKLLAFAAGRTIDSNMRAQFAAVTLRNKRYGH